MNRLGKALSRVLATPNKGGKRRRRRNGSRRRRMARRSNASRVPRGILAGYGSAVTASFYTSRRGDGEVVRGFDLITSPYTPEGNSNISYFITANPASWNGTRIAAIAAGYQNYRPRYLKIHYRPQVGSTSTVSMFIGTMWQNNYITDRSSIEPSLVTSPGGTYLPAWQSSCSVVPLGTHLPQRMYPIRDPDFTTIPFSIICRASDGGPTSPSLPMPGRIFLEYVYEFRNAIGSGASGFQPSSTSKVSVTNQSVYLPTSTNTTSIYRMSGGVTKGWLIDMDGAPSVNFPLFAKLSYEQIVGSLTSGADPVVLTRLKINGVNVNAGLGTGTTIQLYVYTDDGQP